MSKLKYKDDPKEYMRQYYLNNREKFREYQAKKVAANPEREAEYKRRYRNKNRDKHDAYNKAWARANKGKVTAYARNYKLLKLGRIPAWLSDENRLAITEFYVNRPEGHHVDHIVPLKGKNVSGLHVPWNLQYLPARENVKKSNSFK